MFGRNGKRRTQELSLLDEPALAWHIWCQEYSRQEELREAQQTRNFSALALVVEEAEQWTEMSLSAS